MQGSNFRIKVYLKEDDIDGCFHFAGYTPPLAQCQLESAHVPCNPTKDMRFKDDE